MSLEDLVGRTPAQEATAAIVAEQPAQHPMDARTMDLLPIGHVKKRNKEGHWSYHTAPVGDTLPVDPNDMGHHCRICNSQGTADTAKNALYASVGARVKFEPGTFPCHGFSCINIGLYCKRMSDIEYADFMTNDGMGGKDSTWIPYVSHRDHKLPAVSQSSGTPKPGAYDIRYQTLKPWNSFEAHEDTYLERNRWRKVQRLKEYDQLYHQPQGSAWLRSKTERGDEACATLGCACFTNPD